VRAGLKRRLDPRRLSSWFDAANRARDLLRTTLKQDLLLAELLQQWKRVGASR
jgi:DNA polymerase-3 subunit delta'